MRKMDEQAVIRIRGARQNNLKNLDLDLPLGELIVVTGVSGSGKSSLAFDTIYAEGQRRYMETFSSYARMFLERMDPPEVDSVEGIPPAIAIRQVNPVRTSRSTVGTMTEINDHLKLLFAKRARLFCPQCGREIAPDTPEKVMAKLDAMGLEGERLLIAFTVAVPASFSVEETRALLEQQGYRRIVERTPGILRVAQDWVKWEPSKRARFAEGLEKAFEKGHGELEIVRFDPTTGEERETLRYSALRRCPDCGIDFKEPSPNLFSFNSPVGACERCRGFGRIITIDEHLIVPDDTKSIAEGCIKPFQTESFKMCQQELLDYAKRRRFPLRTPWRELTEDQRRWILDGEGDFEKGVWWGVRRFFDWLESRTYKMHVRVMLSRYRAYQLCPDCGGTRLKPEALNWRLVVDEKRLNLHELMTLPIHEVFRLMTALRLTIPTRDAQTLFDEMIPRLQYLCDVGLEYLTLDRQSRTLSGGEVQRINLTQALGSSLVNTLFVLDEPSIGLHPRDVGRLIHVLNHLRDLGNTVLVVEHDPDVIAAADRVIEMGPASGSAGGNIVFQGSLAALTASPQSVTAPYLTGEKGGWWQQQRPPRKADAWITVRGAQEHNLKGITVRFPLHQLVVVTGVSGSGKSTLVNDVLYANCCRRMGKTVESCGACEGLDGIENITDIVLVDQSSIGKTTRSIPASYVGAFDAIRQHFAKLPLAKERGYSYGDFSYNSGVGRCPVCEGTGFEQIEMQFLSDVYLPCEACGGRRYRAEICEVTKRWERQKRDLSIADILELTVEDAQDVFATDLKVLRALKPLADVGLGYIKLGQPVPTLSGGEAQRLKLAGYLAEAKKGGGTLLILDEPTTGLHFTDIEVLLGVFEKLIAEGNSIVVIEHNLLVIRAADTLIDLGPEGGEAGGNVVVVGSPDEVAAHPTSWTGLALRQQQTPWETRCVAETTQCDDSTATPYDVQTTATQTVRQNRIVPMGMNAPRMLSVRRAREHNLQNVDVDIPLNAFTVITGVSGSGKSTLAFDILFALGQRRYLECLNAYARQFVQPQAKPDVLSLSALPPTVAIEQRLSRGGWKSTVATVTEVYNDLRLLFLTLGEAHCPDCGCAIERQTPEQILARVMTREAGGEVKLLVRLVSDRKGAYKDLAEWAHHRGYEQLRVDGTWCATAPWEPLSRYQNHCIDLPMGRYRTAPQDAKALLTGIRAALEQGNGLLRILPLTATGKERPTAEYVASTARVCPHCGTSFQDPDPRLFSFHSHRGHCPQCHGLGWVSSQTGFAGMSAPPSPDHGRPMLRFEDTVQDHLDFETAVVCPVCEGSRLNPEARAFRWHQKRIEDWTHLTVSEAHKVFRTLKLTTRERHIAERIVVDLNARLAFLEKVGLGYLTLDRAIPTLSGGEGQRIRLASQLGSNLCGVCYILDEPTIGLHPRDTGLLLDTLGGLRDKGNTVVVVEHDEQTMRQADYLVDMGPGAGIEGGHVMAQGSFKAVLKNPQSVTAHSLRHPLQHPTRGSYRPCKNVPQLEILGANCHNLKNLDVSIPVGRWTVVTGVSGSGKSTLVRNVLFASLANLSGGSKHVVPKGCREIRGAEHLKRALEVDQSPIGRTPRSCPATYIGFWTTIRELFAATPEAKLRGYDASRFSFNVAAGACPDCSGQGVVRVEMAFLPDVVTPCETCHGLRFNPETLAIRYQGKTIADVLAMQVKEAREFFANHASIHHALDLLCQVGLGYLSLGQQSSTLSGGEAQRIKLVSELARCTPRPDRRVPATLYVLDEPTVGLHMADVAALIDVVHRLVEGGHTVVMIEHNLDMIAEADWILDLGPEGGANGGTLVAAGAPKTLASKQPKRSQTARFLAAMDAKE